MACMPICVCAVSAPDHREITLFWTQVRLPAEGHYHRAYLETYSRFHGGSRLVMQWNKKAALYRVYRRE